MNYSHKNYAAHFLNSLPCAGLICDFFYPIFALGVIDNDEKVASSKRNIPNSSLDCRKCTLYLRQKWP